MSDNERIPKVGDNVLFLLNKDRARNYKYDGELWEIANIYTSEDCMDWRIAKRYSHGLSDLGECGIFKFLVWKCLDYIDEYGKKSTFEGWTYQGK